MLEPVTVRAPGKLLVFGEHAVVYGEPALGVPLSRGITVTLSPGAGRIDVRTARGLRVSRSGNAASPQSLVEAALGPLAGKVDVEIALDIPPMSGFGSSAALAIALLRAKAALMRRRVSNARLLVEAIRVENVAHGKASGVDPAIALYGAPILFQRHRNGPPRIQPVRFGRPIHLIAASTGGHGGARSTVGGISALRTDAPRLVDKAMAALGETTRTGAAALVAGDLALAGRTMDMAHGVLSGFGIVSAEVDRFVRKARALGAYGAKMSGAGGLGGALIALAGSRKDAERIAKGLGRGAWPESISDGS